MANIESWKLEEIREALRLSRCALLEITALDSLEEMEKKCIENQSATTRQIDKCLGWLRYIEED